MSGEDGKEPKDITKEQWMALLQDESVVTAQDIELLEVVFNSKNYEAPASELASQLDKSHYVQVNNQVWRLGQRIVNKLKISAPKRTDGSTMWWNVPFLGKPNDPSSSEELKEGYFYWQLRPELQKAMLEVYGEEELLSEIKSPEEVDVDGQESFYEGAIKQVYVNRYERSRDARDKCIEIYGSKCSVCSFDFEEKYGEKGKGVIHVHHLKPLSLTNENYRVDPKRDLRPVCANCHMIIHKRNPPYSIEEVKAMLTN